MLAAMLTLSVAAAGHRILDGDGDGVRNSKDMCPRTPPGTPVDNNGCSKQQLDADGDGICNPDRPRYKTGPLKGRSVPTFKEWCTGRDNCKFVHNPSQTRNYAKSAAKKRGDACNRSACHGLADFAIRMESRVYSLPQIFVMKRAVVVATLRART
jgi:hypothetical protein